MDKKLKARWLRALRSGQYEKGMGQLVSQDLKRFCCLGVLADLQGAEFTVVDNGELPTPGNQRNGFYLLGKWACGLSLAVQRKLGRINDDFTTFEPVIEYIKKNL